MPLTEYNSAQDVIDYFEETILGSTNIPDWYLPLFKTIASKNLTINDWNLMFEQLKKNISQTNTVVEVMDAFMKLAEDYIQSQEIVVAENEPEDQKDGAFWYEVKV